MKLTVCVTAQYESVTMMGFKVKEFAENMLTPSTVGSLTLTKKNNLKKITVSVKVWVASNFLIESIFQDQTRGSNLFSN